MKSSTLSIAFAAVLMAAAFAGIMLVADDVNAEGGGDSGTDEGTSDGTSSTETTSTTPVITYKLDKVVATDTITGSVMTLKSPAELNMVVPDGKEFKGWKLDGDADTIYQPGSQISVTEAMKFVAELKDVEYTVTFKVGDVTRTASGTAGQSITVPTDIKTDKEGFIFLGWAVADEEPIKDFTDVKFTEDVTYVAQYSIDYKVSFTLKGTEIATCYESGIIKSSADLKTIISIVPYEENYTFNGWADELGNIVVKYMLESKAYVLDTDYKFESDTELRANFSPVQLTVTLVVGDDIQTQTVLYEKVFLEPKLPSGYACWATMEIIDDEEVYTEFDFSQPIYEDIVLYAQAVDPSAIYNVTFEIEGKAAVIQKTDSIVIPNPSVDGKVFKGWVVKGESNYVDPATYSYTSDVTFVAIYDKAPAPAGPGFFQTTAGQCTAVIIAVLIIALVYAVYSNMFGMKDFLTSFKVQRVKKE